jgi:hypothetical protein
VTDKDKDVIIAVLRTISTEIKSLKKTKEILETLIKKEDNQKLTSS